MISHLFFSPFLPFNLNPNSGSLTPYGSMMNAGFAWRNKAPITNHSRNDVELATVTTILRHMTTTQYTGSYPLTLS